MDPTPVTIGLVLLVVAAISCAVGIVLWLVRRFEAVEARIDSKIGDLAGTMSSRLDAMEKDIDNDRRAHHDRMNLVIVAQSEHRTYVAENYMSKRSHEAVANGIVKSVENLQQSMEARMLRMDSKLDAMRAS